MRSDPIYSGISLSRGRWVATGIFFGIGAGLVRTLASHGHY
jgi:hypothetical protein